ncbi:MAG TPA: ATP-binding protein [bacterium]|nr:ATP-binding protein [bacterium]HPN30640.1 ATP-binding protein [bacterium]
MNLNGKNILIASNNLKLINYLTGYILQNNAIPFTANDLNQSFDIIKNESIDLIISEAKYSSERRTESEDLLKFINKNFLFIPVVIILKQYEINLIKHSLKNGATSFFIEPFDIDDLISEINKIKPIRVNFDNRMKILNGSSLRYSVEINSSAVLVGAVGFNISEIFKILHPEKTDAVNSIMLAANEIILNAIIHGNKNDESKKVNITALIESNRFQMIVTDEGNGFDYQNLPDPTDSQFIFKDSGRGIYLTKMYFDEINFYLGGSRVELIKNFK